MIRFKSLRYKNAVTFQETVEISLEHQGRVFLKGENKDTGGSNGAGKSTIFEVLQHILFSSTSKGFARNQFAGDGYFAELILEADGHEYKILQFRGAKKQERTNGYKIYKDKVDVTPKGTRHMADCITYIKNIIGITEEEFRGYVYLAQEGAGHVLISGKGAEKRDYLSDLFSLDRYDLVKAGVDDELEAVKAQIAALSEKAAVRDEVESQLAALPMSSDDFEAMSDSIENTSQFVHDKNAVWSDRIKEADSALSRYEDRKGVRQKLDLMFPKWDELDVDDVSETRQAKLRKLNARISKLEELEALVSEKTELEAAYDSDVGMTEQEAAASLGRSQTRLAKMQAELDGIRRRIVLEEKLPQVRQIGDDVPERLKDAQGSLSVIKHQLEESKTNITKLAKLTESECPTCGQSLDTEAIAEQLTKAEGMAKTMKSALKTTTTEVAALRGLCDTMDEYNRLAAQIGELPTIDLTEHRESIDETEKGIPLMQEVLEQARENVRISKRLAELVESLVEFPDSLDVSKLEDYREKSSKLEKSLGKLETIKVLKEQFSGMEEIDIIPDDEYAHISEMAEFYQNAVTELAIQKQQAEASKKTAETLQNRLSELDTQLSVWESVQLRRSLFEAMKAAYGPKGLKIHQLKKVCNAICRTLPKYTTIMFQEPRVEFFVDNDPDSTDIEFFVRRFGPEGTKEYPVGKLSGGEKKRLAVAMIFSLAELVSPRKRCNLVILDEVGDGLDPIGEEAFASQLLPKLSQDTVICTSHRSGIAAAQFDTHWTVTKKDNVSTFSVD
jgi:DNA repair exonuclease SbcCD ATPase subunit